jgi:hypothetical protein
MNPPLVVEKNQRIKISWYLPKQGEAANDPPWKT